MKFEISYLEENKIFELILFDDADVDVFRELLKDFTSHRNWKSGLPVLVNQNDLNSSTLRIVDVLEIANECIKYKEIIGNSKMGLVTCSSCGLKIKNG